MFPKRNQGTGIRTSPEGWGLGCARQGSWVSRMKGIPWLPHLWLFLSFMSQEQLLVDCFSCLALSYLTPPCPVHLSRAVSPLPLPSVQEKYPFRTRMCLSASLGSHVSVDRRAPDLTWDLESPQGCLPGSKQAAFVERTIHSANHRADRAVTPIKRHLGYQVAWGAPEKHSASPRVSPWTTQATTLS